MPGPTHLKSLHALHLALKFGSLKAAAEELAVTPAAVGQRIKALEDYLGFELLSRGRLRIRPTPELRPAAEHLALAFDELDTVAHILNFQRTNEIHVAAHPDFADLWLNPRLNAFRAAHPHILFCVNGEGDVPLRLGQADCEIDFGRPRGDGEVDLLFKDFLVPIGSAEMLERISKISSRTKLEGFPLLHLDFFKDDPKAIGWPEWIGAHGHRKTALQRGVRFRRIAPAVDAVVSNAGLLICGLALIRPLIDEGRVCFPYSLSTGAWTQNAFRARFRSSALLKPQVKRFRDWLIDEARGTQGWLRQTLKAAGA